MHRHFFYTVDVKFLLRISQPLNCFPSRIFHPALGVCNSSGSGNQPLTGEHDKERYPAF